MKRIENKSYNQLGQYATINIAETKNYSLWILYFKHSSYDFYLEVKNGAKEPLVFNLSYSEFKELFIVFYHFDSDYIENILGKEFCKNFDYDVEYPLFDTTYCVLAEALISQLIYEKSENLRIFFNDRFNQDIDIETESNFFVSVYWIIPKYKCKVEIMYYDFTILFKYSLSDIANDIYNFIKPNIIKTNKFQKGYDSYDFKNVLQEIQSDIDYESIPYNWNYRCPKSIDCLPFIQCRI